jgi:hypothetical protein
MTKPSWGYPLKPNRGAWHERCLIAYDVPFGARSFIKVHTAARCGGMISALPSLLTLMPIKVSGAGDMIYAQC